MPPGAEPSVSAVIATRDRPARLAALLDALRAQTLAAEEFEVVVVDEGSEPETRTLLEAARAQADLRLRVVRHERPRGPGAARNAGLRVAHGDLIAFTDDDCRPAAGWLEAGLDAHARAPEAVVQGQTEPDPADRARRGPFTRTVQVRGMGPGYETCNIFYPRELLQALGGFDEGFGLRPGGEDTDLAWRAMELGRPTAFCSEALVYHAVVELGLMGALREATRWTETMRVFARHPGAREALDHRLFWNVWHYLIVRSALALLLPRRLRPLRWVILARHAMAMSGRVRTLDARPWVAAALLVYDFVELVAVVRGAIRHRTIVL
jgi:glycosyltransferase involved in cell wall biosynthesis